MTESFGCWLNKQLQRREWNQADLSRATGIAPSRVNDWVRNIRLPNPVSCERIADALRVDLDDVLALAGHRLNHVDDPETAALISLIRRIKWDEDRRAFTRSLLESMLNVDEARAARRSPPRPS